MEPIYLKDSYIKEFEAIVKDIREFEGSILLVLDNTAFYPVGGGQPYDTGKIISKNKEYRVIEVYKYKGEILHKIEEKEIDIKIGEKIKGIIDWDRRYKLMKMHTAAHLISALMHSLENVMISGNQLGIEKSRIDFTLEKMDKEKIKKVIEKANELIKEGRKVKTYYMKREDALKIEGITKLAKGLPDLEELRIVEIEGIDIQADGGTHVKDIKEIGHIDLIKIENKGKNNRRIYFTLD